MSGKYDKRRFNKIKRPHRKALKATGAKPKWLKTLKANEAAKTLRELDSIASPAAIYAQAHERGLLALCWDMRKSVEERLLGRPFVAINPAEVKTPGIVDNRLQIAIQQLIPGKKQPVKRGKKQAQLADGVQVVEAIEVTASQEGAKP
jgi:hypothetical protein